MYYVKKEIIDGYTFLAIRREMDDDLKDFFMFSREGYFTIFEEHTISLIQTILDYSFAKEVYSQSKMKMCLLMQGIDCSNKKIDLRSSLFIGPALNILADNPFFEQKRDVLKKRVTKESALIFLNPNEGVERELNSLSENHKIKKLLDFFAKEKAAKVLEELYRLFIERSLLESLFNSRKLDNNFKTRINKIRDYNSYMNYYQQN